ncbi:hypothetical protein MMC12_005637 [Toensbergia leucococca]|nr:hypothetical protein [Toensbergia leucococca]
MSSSTAIRWFVPDSEFDLSVEDYAVAGAFTCDIRACISDQDTLDHHPQRTTYYDIVSGAGTGRGCYAFGRWGTLIYADVDENDPNHKEEIYNVRAKELPLQEEDIKMVELKKKFQLAIDALDLTDDQEIREHNEWVKEHDALITERATRPIATPWLNPDQIDYLMGLVNQEEQRDLLSALSGQSKIKTQHPVMMLVNMINKGQNFEIGVTEGWVVAYDFAKDLLFIKPFVSTKDHHPLGGKWQVEPNDDGVSICPTVPGMFMKNLIELAEGPEDKDQAHSFRMAIHVIVAKWVQEHWTALSGISGSDHGELLTDELKSSSAAAIKMMKKQLKETPFPSKEKAPPAKEPIWEIEAMQTWLEDHEPEMRYTTVKLKDKGKENVAENIAKLYEEMLKALESFNEDPEKDLNI